MDSSVFVKVEPRKRQLIFQLKITLKHLEIFCVDLCAKDKHFVMPVDDLKSALSLYLLAYVGFVFFFSLFPVVHCKSGSRTWIWFGLKKGFTFSNCNCNRIYLIFLEQTEMEHFQKISHHKYDIHGFEARFLATSSLVCFIFVFFSSFNLNK